MLGVDLGMWIGWMGRWWVDVDLGWVLGVGIGVGEGASWEYYIFGVEEGVRN